jgi:hypothetical protein
MVDRLCTQILRHFWSQKRTVSRHVVIYGSYFLLFLCTTFNGPYPGWKFDIRVFQDYRSIDCLPRVRHIVHSTQFYHDLTATQVLQVPVEEVWLA